MASSTPKHKRRSTADLNTTSESQILPPRQSIPTPITGNDDSPPPDSSDSDSPPAGDDQPDLPLSMSTSLLLTSPNALPTDARTALAQINATLDPPDQKIQVRFHAIGGAPLLKQKVFKISASSKFGSVVSFLRKKLGLNMPPIAGAESGAKGAAATHQQVGGLFCYINQVFAPGLDEGVGNLWRCFKTDETLIVAYSITPAFG